MKKIFIILSLVVSAFFCLESPVSGARHNDSTVRESVTFITDRTIYLTGEQIWFSARVSINQTDSTRQLSNVLYVEIFRNKSVVVKKKFQITNGKVQGMIPIPEELPSANYYLRVYTKYQRNFPVKDFFTTMLTLVNPENAPGEPDATTDNPIAIKPEGGRLIDGISAFLAVQIHPRWYHAMKSCLLKNNHQKTIDTISFSDNGLALVPFTPCDSLDYHVVLTLKSGDSLIKLLPKVLPDGITMSVNPFNHAIRMNATKGYLETASSNHTLYIFSGGQRVATISVKVNEPRQTILFNSFPKSGIYTIFLTNPSGDIISYSATYIPPGLVTLPIQTNRDEFHPRDKVNLTIKTRGLNPGKIACLTLSVVKSGTRYSVRDGLPSCVLNNPDLLPAFSPNLNITDSLMATQIKTLLMLHEDSPDESAITSNTTYRWQPEIRGVSLSGIIRDAKTKEPLAGKWIYASVLGNHAQIHAYRSGDDGEFLFSLNQLEDHQQLSLSTDSIPGVETEFLIFNDFADRWPLFKDIPLIIDSTRQIVLNEMLRNYEVSKYFQPKEKTDSDSLQAIPFPFTDVQSSTTLADYVALPTMTETLNEVVDWVKVSQHDGKPQITVIDPTKAHVYNHPFILVDNLPVYNVADVLAINPANVKSVDVITRVYSIGDLLIEGVLIIHTKTDDFAGIRLPSTTVFTEYQTITPAASVSFPAYDVSNRVSGRDPDFRNLLYWNPSVTLNNNETSVSFYTDDETTNYEIVLEGKTTDGKTIFGRKIIRVQE